MDYFLASQELLQSISFFHVDKFYADLSDHCQISLMLKVHCDNLSQHTEINMYPLYQLNINGTVLQQIIL